MIYRVQTPGGTPTLLGRRAMPDGNFIPERVNRKLANGHLALPQDPQLENSSEARPNNNTKRNDYSDKLFLL